MNTNRHTLHLYWQQGKKYKPSFFGALFCIPVSSLFMSAFLPYFYSQIIGNLSDNNGAAVWSNVALTAAVGMGGVLLNLVGFQFLLFHEASTRSDLSNDTFKQLANKDVRFFAGEKVGALTGRFIDFVQSEMDLNDMLIIRTLGFVISFIVSLIIVASHSLVMAIIIIFTMTGLLLQIRWSLKYRLKWRTERKQLDGEINGDVADAITNNLIVKTFAGEERETAALAKKNARFKTLVIKDIGFVSREGSARVGLMTVIQIIAIALCSYFAINGQMTIAVVVFTLGYLQQISSQIFSLGEIMNGYDRALLKAAPMSDILAQDNCVTDSPTASTLDNITPTLSIENVSYKYSDSSDDVLKRINLMIPAGQKVGLVGQSGAGKTTITHLLLRFMDVTDGSIKIDGHDVRDITQESLRQNIAYVPQEPALFHRSLRDNIAYGKPDATDKEVREAAKQANALEFIDKLPKGLDTTVGERGLKLSGGQRQRIAIARAILKNAPILILDEATSALDSDSEKLVHDALRKLMRDRTSIVIAHRLSTIASLDRIVVLNNGKVTEDGTHTELIKQNGIYAKLWSHQSGGFLTEE